ncbi:CrpP-related protein [Rhizobium sullae]|uniref:CrpP-related protein n=1 Tax=Rhizobium sullae TaxID=50338 RepID=UPI00040769E7
MEIEELLDMQERGIRDRVLGYTLSDNPMSRPELMPIRDVTELEVWYARYEAWRFGWSVEDANRRH